MYYYPYSAALPTSARLDNSERFENGNPSYKNYHNYNEYDVYFEPEMVTSNAYYDLVSSCKYRHQDWKTKAITDWTAKDTVSWLIEYIVSQGFYEGDVPFYNFRVSGNELRNMRREEIVQRMAHPNVDPNLSIKIAHKFLEALKSADIYRQTSAYRYTQNEPSSHHDLLQSVFDFDEYSDRTVSHYQTNEILLPVLDSKNDAEDGISNLSPKDKKDKNKLIKKPPGRPKGIGKNKIKQPRNESVPEFLWNCLMDESKRHLIDWEEYSQLKFRFIKPDEVAKLWGQMKQNDNMTFEKFSRAMRYHYRQKVLVSVPSARLVYQFGSKGPDFKTQNPNFVKVKSELDLQDMSYS